MEMNDPFDLNGIAERDRQAEAAVKAVQKQTEEDFKWIMQDKRGRRFIWQLLERGSLFHPSFNGTLEGTCFADGTKSEARLVMAYIFAYCPERFTEMMMENNNGGSPSS